MDGFPAARVNPKASIAPAAFLAVRHSICVVHSEQGFSVLLPLNQRVRLTITSGRFARRAGRTTGSQALADGAPGIADLTKQS
jgi:hypothetical protein